MNSSLAMKCQVELGLMSSFVSSDLAPMINTFVGTHTRYKLVVVSIDVYLLLNFNQELFCYTYSGNKKTCTQSFSLNEW